MSLEVFCDVCLNINDRTRYIFQIKTDRKTKLNGNVVFNIHHLNPHSTYKLERHVITMACYLNRKRCLAQCTHLKGIPGENFISNKIHYSDKNKQINWHQC